MRELTTPESVAIVAMGASCNQYIEATKNAGSRFVLADETWAINAMGGNIEHDRWFHMDDVAVQEIRAEKNKWVEGLLKALKRGEGPIYTSKVREGYPGLVAYPLEEVLNKLNCGRWPYFNTTVAFAVAYAIFIGVKKMSLYGMDFLYANGQHAEEGRACVEYWLGYAAAKGISVAVASSSTLLDMTKPLSDRLYGYDGVEVKITGSGGLSKVEFVDKELPTAEEIEARYHEKHVPAAPKLGNGGNRHQRRAATAQLRTQKPVVAKGMPDAAKTVLKKIGVPIGD